MTYKVYSWICKIDGKRYVGCTSKSVEERAGSNMAYYRNSVRFYAAIKEHGCDNFEYEILADDLTAEEATDLEAYYIEAFHTRDPEKGYNVFKGGYHTYTAEEALVRAQKIATTIQAQRNTPEWREHIRGKLHAHYDTHEKYVAMMEARRENNTGGEPGKRVYCHETDTVYESQMEAGRALGFKTSNISSSFRRHASRSIVVGKNKGTIYHLDLVD
jgi:group I intron endonuclease